MVARPGVKGRARRNASAERGEGGQRGQGRAAQREVGRGAAQGAIPGADGERRRQMNKLTLKPGKPMTGTGYRIGMDEFLLIARNGPSLIRIMRHLDCPCESRAFKRVRFEMVKGGAK